MTDRVEHLAAPSEKLAAAGMATSLAEDGETLALKGRFGVRAPVLVTWERDSMLVRVEQLTKVGAGRLGDRDRRAKVLASIREEGVIAHAIVDRGRDRDGDSDGTIVFRTHLFTCADGPLEIATLGRVLAALGDEAATALRRHVIPAGVRVTWPWKCYAE